MSGQISISDFRPISDSYVSLTYKIGVKFSRNQILPIYKVKDLKTGQKKAMKIISKFMISSTRTETYLIHEVSALLQLDHPNILKLFDYFQDSSNFYIVFERYQGGPLLSRINLARKHSEAVCKTYALQIFSIFAALREKNIVYRNLKIENLLFLSQNSLTLKLINFKHCRILEKNERLSETTGVPLYMAPEVIIGNYNIESDMWSVGVLIYLLLSGTFPFRGNSSAAIISSVAKGTYNFNGNHWQRISEEAKDLVSKLLCKIPSQRITPEQALAHPWFMNLTQNSVDIAVARPIAANLGNFKSKTSFKKSLLKFLGNHFLNNTEKEELLEMFLNLDSDKNGFLSQSEIKEGFLKIFGNRVRNADDLVQKIFNEVDLDGNGEISYNEFIVAAMNTEKLMQKERLKCVFEQLDTDNSGFIDIRELRNNFQRFLIDHDEQMIEELVKEFDKNGDGVINFEEFINSMNQK